MIGMTWNATIQRLARLTPFRRGVWARFLRPGVEIHPTLFGKYRFEMDLSHGFLQKIYFLKPTDYEPDTLRTLQSFVKPGMTVLDIGANTGFLTLRLADLVGAAGRVYSFEPFPDNFRLLEKNVKTNQLAQVSIFPIALSNRNGTADLTRNPRNDGGHSLGDQSQNPDLAGWDPETLKIRVPTQTLDDFIAEHRIPRVDFIKIDVEGAECLVFGGAPILLARPDAPVILCEVAEAAQRAFQRSEGDLRRLLYQVGYHSFWPKKGFPELPPNEPVKGLHNVLFRKIVSQGTQDH